MRDHSAIAFSFTAGRVAGGQRRPQISFQSREDTLDMPTVFIFSMREAIQHLSSVLARDGLRATAT